MRIFNSLQNKPQRQILRKNQTDAEKTLWYYLRNRNFLGIKFYRQYGIGSYIVDFYSSELKLVVEVDGGQHFVNPGISSDAKRDSYLRSLNLKILRFSNFEVLGETEAVLEKICLELPLIPSFKKRGEE